MKKIESLSLKSLRNEELCGFTGQIAALVRPDSILYQSVQFQKFLSTLDQYKIALRSANSIGYKDLIEQDNRVDQIWSGYFAQIKALRVHPLETIRQDAEQIYQILSKSKKPTRLNYDEGYAIYGRQLATISQLDPQILQNTFSQGWLDGFRIEFDRFVEMRRTYQANNVSLGPGHVKSARDQMTASYKDFCQYLMGLSIVSPSIELDRLIEHVNLLIETKKNALKQRSNRGNNSSQESTAESSSETEPAEEE